MKAKLLLFLVSQIFEQLPEDKGKEVIDDFLDVIENRFADRPAIMKGLAYIRKVVDVPDDIGGDKD